MNIWKRLFGKESRQAPVRHVRAFKGALPTRFTNWLYSSFSKINSDTNEYQITLLARARELAKGNTVVRSWLENMEKNILGEQGFVLQSQVKTGNELDVGFNNELEWKWYDWNDPLNGMLTVDGKLGGDELDKLILRTYLIDGEVFIRVHKSPASPYGVKFELIDAMSIDYTKIREAGSGNNAIVLGVEIDSDGREVAYWTKKRKFYDLPSGSTRKNTRL